MLNIRPPTPWQAQLSDLITTAGELCACLDLDADELACHYPGLKRFPLKVSRSFVARMCKGDMNDPLLRQILPVDKEAIKTPGFEDDPLKETQVNPIPGLLHKYHGRVLLLVNGSCSVHCRYCFRRHFPYADNNPGMAGRQKALAYIAHDESIDEVILSGGDPLVLGDKSLARLIHAISEIAHVKRLRIHSRVPITLPARINRAFLECTMPTRLHRVMVVHCNHPQEINDEVNNSLTELRLAGFTVLNQAVLLQGINDDATVLIELSKRLFDQGVLPYYLHLLDQVSGSAHFHVSEQKAKQLMKVLLARLPGYLVPKLVREQSGCCSKTPISLEGVL